MKAITEELPGFSFDDDPVAPPTASQKKRDKATKSKGGGFQLMGLSYPILKGITKRGYKVPTPIQRKTIPLILEGRDVVAMAKTGSGKTACFLIPMFEKLKQRIPTMGARALILSPTRELAVQTFRFFKELGKFTDLKSILVLGGDSIDSQFSAVNANPDIVVATPGRFLHVCVEMELKLTAIQYVVMDEADRLFEMGFGEQLSEILHRLPSAKQMVMFSATLPKQLVDFARAGLSDPVLIRLDVESKLPEHLQLKFVHCRPDERYATLLAILKNIVPDDGQTVVFAGTQHHVELLGWILNTAGISNAIVYSSLDPTARKINTALFLNKKVSVLVVTDIAARGLDIPSLDYVVNVHFPGKPKLFVHRVGRCARAGRHGTAYTICSTDDQAHLLDLHLFLNRPFNINDTGSIGIVPPDLVEEEHRLVMEWMKRGELSGVVRTSTNAYKQYIKSRPPASVDSNKRVKNIKFDSLKPLDGFLFDRTFGVKTKKIKKVPTNVEANIFEDKYDLLKRMKEFRPAGTVFELNTHKTSVPNRIMKEKRKTHEYAIEKFKQKLSEIERDVAIQEENHNHEAEAGESSKIDEPDEEEIKNAFKRVIVGRKRISTDDLYKKKFKKPKRKPAKDPDNYIGYQAADKHTEDGLAVSNVFEREARKNEFSMMADNAEGIKMERRVKKWDRVRKKMVSVQDPRQGKIRTEAGLWIPATYKTGRYDAWKEKTKFEEQRAHEAGENSSDMPKKPYPVKQWARHNAKVAMKKVTGTDRELKTTDQIAKGRIRLDNIKERDVQSRLRNTQRKRISLKKQSKQKGKQKKSK